MSTKPNFKIIANSQDITGAIKEQFISLTLMDRRGMKSDEATLVLNDIGTPFKWPKKGAELNISIGFGNKLANKGLFKVDNVIHRGPPDQLTIVAKAADMIGALKAQVTASYHQQSIKQIMDSIAARHGLTSAVSQKLGAIVIEHIDQAEESDLHFITRLARKYNAIAKPTNGKLLFVGKNEAKTASGAAMPEIAVLINELDSYSLEEQSRTQYSGVKAYYNDTKSAQRKGVLAGKSGNVKTLKPSYANKKEATDKANSELSRLKNEAFKGELSFKHGRAELVAESLITPTGKGWRSEYLKKWIAAEVVHTLNSTDGLSTRIMFESY